MKNTDDRKLFGTPIGAGAAAGNIATIPPTQTTAGDGTASVALGFPPETFIARAAGGEPPRGQDMNGLLNLLSSATQVLQAGYLGPFDAAFAQSIGGYPAGAIVAGAAPGAFWVSTTDANVSTPGAEGATWQSLFNGYATQAWANGQFLQLALATLQSVTGPVAFGGRMQVPSISAFTGLDALNAVTAEGRYVRSVPAAGGTNVRIVDVQEDAAGNMIATRADGTTQSYTPGSAGIIPATSTLGAVYWTRQGDILTQSFQIVAAYSGMYQAFPFAYRAGTVPNLTATAGATANGYVAQVQVATPQYPNQSATTNVGILLSMPCWSGGGTSHVVSSLPVALNLTIVGEV
ncbi:hypothetical protein [Acetobacter sp. LMG 32666]|uniref:hypothetical protein n=1 Tax=Acetobacter sp. LMG 32666 TaxID=2959295 RepID=UPI0030C845A9